MVERKSDGRYPGWNRRGSRWGDCDTWSIAGTTPDLASEGHRVQMQCLVIPGLMSFVMIPDNKNVLDR